MSTTLLPLPEPPEERHTPVTADLAHEAAIARPVNQPSRWAAPDLVDEEPGRHGLSMVFLFALLMFISIADLIDHRRSLELVGATS